MIIFSYNLVINLIKETSCLDNRLLINYKFTLNENTETLFNQVTGAQK